MRSNISRDAGNHPFTVVLTGGIASGKSTVSDFFLSLGVPVIDTDVIAREIVELGQPALKEIEEKFGKEFLLPTGELDRKKLRYKIFSDRHARTILEAITHPRILAKVREKLDKIEAPYCMVVVPLYAESGSYSWTDRVLVVEVPRQAQVERLMMRDGITREFAEAMVNAQSGPSERMSFADDVICNDKSLTQLKSEVKMLHQKYLRLSTAPWESRALPVHQKNH